MMDNDNQYGYDSPEPAQSESYTDLQAQPEYGYQGSGQPDYVEAPKPKQSNMALASLVMGIVGIVTSCCCYGGLIFGSLGIVFALLSKVNEKFEGYALAGLITSIIAWVLAVIFGVVLLAGSAFRMLGGIY